MPTVTVKLSESESELLKQLCESTNGKKSKSEVIRNLLQSNTKVIRGNTDDLDVWKKELEEKNRQIERLQQALDQEQQLHMATKQEIRLLSEPRKHWWNRRGKAQK